MPNKKKRTKVFTVDELNRMGLEAMAGRERTSVKGAGAQETYTRIKAEIEAIRRAGGTPLPVDP